jgi:hypothetical protein
MNTNELITNTNELITNTNEPIMNTNEPIMNTTESVPITIESMSIVTEPSTNPNTSTNTIPVVSTESSESTPSLKPNPNPNPNSDQTPLTLSAAEQRELFAGLFEHIGEVHLTGHRQDLVEFTQEYRNRRKKGIVLLHYNTTKDMIQSVKHDKFLYTWIGENEARHFKHNGIQSAVTTMNPKEDCVLAASLQLGTNHIHMNCYKFSKIVSR